MKSTKRWIRWSIALFLGLGLWGGFAPALQAQSAAAVAERFDVEIRVHLDGTMEITEHQTIRFNGTFRRGFREIPLRRTEGITILDLREDEAIYRRASSGQPFTYEVEESREGITVRWFFPPTTNAVRTFHLRYQVRGAIRRYPEGDQLWWNPLPAEHAYEIRHSTVTVILPPRGAGPAGRRLWPGGWGDPGRGSDCALPGPTPSPAG